MIFRLNLEQSLLRSKQCERPDCDTVIGVTMSGEEPRKKDSLSNWTFKIPGSGTNRLNKDGHLITEDSVFPTTAPGGAPKRNRCYQDARYFIFSPPCARFARALGAPRTAHFATPPLGAGAIWLMAS
jgi:hypothetical protein